MSDQVLPRLDLRDAGIADLDGDGDLDIVLVQNNGGNLILFNNGAGDFSAIGVELAEGANTGVNIADLDGDGDLDLFL